jgi:predicted dehydrogenase
LSAKEALPLEVLTDVYFNSRRRIRIYGLDALLDRKDISAVIIALPITVQPDIILKALANKKHVLSENSVAPSRAVAWGSVLLSEYHEKYKSRGLIWRVAENHEVEPAFVKAGKLIKDGKIGKVVLFSVKMVNLSKGGERKAVVWPIHSRQLTFAKPRKSERGT